MSESTPNRGYLESKLGAFRCKICTSGAKVSVSKTNHANVVKFIKTNVMKCEIGQELILKYTYSKATGKLTYTSDLCPFVSAKNVSKLADHFWAHFNAPPTCNPHGLMHSSGSCQEAVANGGSIGNGKLGETQIIVSGSKIVVDTKVKDGEVLNNTIEFSSFSELAKQESVSGFSERPPHAERFFRKGVSGQWNTTLQQYQIKKIIKAHGQVMNKLGYKTSS